MCGNVFIKGDENMKIGDRIKEIRKNLNLNQTAFGERLSLKQTTIAGYETGKREPLDTIIYSICREFDVCEEWLRYGKGPMFVQLSRDEGIASFVGEVLKDENDTFKKRFISMLSRLDESDWETVAKMAELMAEKKEQAEDLLQE